MRGKRNIIEMTGLRFGRLVVLRRDGNSPCGSAKWLCKCDCGKEVSVTGTCLRRGGTVSCGCYGADIRKSFGVKHGKSYTRIYSIYSKIIQRCYNKNSKLYKNYGYRGITMCDEWRNNFQAFYDWAMANGYTDKLSIDRIDNYKGYSPDNCRWLTPKEQGRNLRRSVYLTINGETKLLMDWCTENNLNIQTVRNRVARGVPSELLLEKSLKYLRGNRNERNSKISH